MLVFADAVTKTTARGKAAHVFRVAVLVAQSVVVAREASDSAQ